MPVEQNQRRLKLAEEKYDDLTGEPKANNDSVDDFNDEFENKQIVAEGNMIDYQSMFHELPQPCGTSQDGGAGRPIDLEAARQPQDEVRQHREPFSQRVQQLYRLVQRTGAPD